MVNFGKLLKSDKSSRSLNPVDIFERLDKTSGKDELRDSQRATLQEWFAKARAQKDVVIKLHTGQGKTLVGLLALLSSMRELGAPAMYLCPDNNLVDQTLAQAQQFGVPAVGFGVGGPGMPPAFLNGKSILVTNYSKLFNGQSVFGVGGVDSGFTEVGAIALDDAHRGIEIIREAFTIRVRKEGLDSCPEGFQELLALFREPLSRQGKGTFTDIESGENKILAVPFWAWQDRLTDVTGILSGHRTESAAIRFPWNLVKDQLDSCTCVVSGREIEIAPRVTPVDAIPTFPRASRRLYLSATLTEDSYLVRDLGVAEEVVRSPVSKGDVAYSGERIILLPSLVNPEIRRAHVIAWAVKHAQRFPNSGHVCLVPATWRGEEWEKQGARIVRRESIVNELDQFSGDVGEGKANYVLVLSNRYDGIDLPDRTCRLLVLDSLPGRATLNERYQAMVQVSTEQGVKRTAQRIEQGMGRGIRGSSDYCVVVVTGDDLTDFLTVITKRAFFSNEVQRQIETGERLVELMRTEGKGMEIVDRTIQQVLNRDEQWKEYYVQTMEGLTPTPLRSEDLRLAQLERSAELSWRDGSMDKTVKIVESIIEGIPQADKGWYLQLLGSYLYRHDRARALETQVKAYRTNHNVLKPETGVEYTKLTFDGHQRARSILGEISRHREWNELIVAVRGQLDKLVFDSDSETFEDGIDALGRLLGFATSRPERESGEGPDNLWRVGGGDFWLIECKNQVDEGTPVIGRAHTEQLENSVGWLRAKETDPRITAILAHPSTTLERGAYPREDVWVLSAKGLSALKSEVEAVYQAFKSRDLSSVTEAEISEKLRTLRLDSETLRSKALVKVKPQVSKPRH